MQVFYYFIRAYSLVKSKRDLGLCFGLFLEQTFVKYCILMLFIHHC